MKRMSEVFELPVKVDDREYCADEVFHAGGNGEWCATFCENEQAQHAAHAINHVDALADALEELLKNSKSEDVYLRVVSYEVAEAVLAAYRGYK